MVSVHFFGNAEVFAFRTTPYVGFVLRIHLIYDDEYDTIAVHQLMLPVTNNVLTAS